MGRNDNDNRGEWAASALNHLVETGLTPEAVVTAFLHILAGTAPSSGAFSSLINEVVTVAAEVSEAIKAAQPEPDAEPELPAEVKQAMAMLGIDPSQVSVFTPRSTGKQAASACDCNRCVVENAKAGFLVNGEGEA